MEKEHIANPDAYFSAFETFLLEKMPGLNQAIQAGVAKSNEWMFPIQWFLSSVPPTSTLNHAQKIRCIQYFGFALSSYERHRQGEGMPMGEALQSIPALEDYLLRLSNETGHAPRDTMYTYCTINRKPGDQQPRLLFTGNPQEILFLEVLNKTNDHLTQAGNKARPIARQLLSPTDPDAVKALNEGIEHLWLVRKQLYRYMKKDPETGEFALSKKFFRENLRQYNCTWLIGGTKWSGPSGVDIAAQQQLDFISGIINAKYIHHVNTRTQYLSPEDRLVLASDQRAPSLLDLVMDMLQVTPEQFNLLSESAIADIIRKQSFQQRQFVESYVKFAKVNALISATHEALLRQYLINPNKEQTIRESDYPVTPTKGTANGPFSEVIAIKSMRTEDPRLLKLSAALQT